jgi:eukaryotic-like serine/threonine-protein kinase
VTLASGSRLGPYEIVSPLGAGGMGEVYRARDTKLNRDVALKVIPDTFALDPDRVARFTREAQVLASLNHPHIAAIYGFEDSGKTHALVLELVEGETLADRIARGPLPLDEALPIARQICEALEAAHEPGIIHRDLKPANIKITPEGVVKVLDFGLAKLTDPAHAPAANVSWSPTLTSPALMTGVGVILGTAAYMSPEQAKGRPADKRSDLWAFGCVLYEMLTGTRPFDGEDVTDVMVAVLSKEPDWSALPKFMPTPITRLLHRSLEKDRRRRLDSAAAARLEIDEAIAAPAIDKAVARAAVRGPRRQRMLPWAVAVVALIAGVTMLLVWAPWRPLPASASLRLEVTLGADASLVIAPGGAGMPAGSATDVSPDGSQLAFVAQPHGVGPRLYIRRLDQLTATPLAGTDGAVGPFFSPDGQWLGFFSAGKLRKIAVTGGAPVKLADAPSSRGGSWAEDGTIVFAPVTGSGGGLWRVPAEGGTAVRLTTPATGEATHR